MAVAYISEFPIGDQSTENYEFMKEKLAGEEIDGLIVHTAGFDDDNGVWRLVDVWESRKEQAEAVHAADDGDGQARGAPSPGHGGPGVRLARATTSCTTS